MSSLPRICSFYTAPYSPMRSRRKYVGEGCCKSSSEDVRGEVDDGSEEVDRAMHMDGSIPGTSDEFVKRVSSRAYDMRRHLHQSFDSSSYDGNDFSASMSLSV